MSKYDLDKLQQRLEEDRITRAYPKINEQKFDGPTPLITEVDYPYTALFVDPHSPNTPLIFRIAISILDTRSAIPNSQWRIYIITDGKTYHVDTSNFEYAVIPGMQEPVENLDAWIISRTHLSPEDQKKVDTAIRVWTIGQVVDEDEEEGNG